MSLFLSAAHKSSGKTTVAIGVLAALRGRGYRVQSFKKGPDYIDPMWHRRASGRPCLNLDFHTQPADEIRAEFDSACSDAELALIEGNKGLYDGLDLDGSNSNAALAHLLDSPVVLILDTRGMTRGVAPLILGYQAFDPAIRIAGVILNRVGGRRHESKLRAVIEHYTQIPVLGAVAQDPGLNIDERHLGLVPSNEADAAQALVDHLGKVIGDQVDLDALAELARLPAVSRPAHARPAAISGRRIRLGVIMDRAFGFYYPGDLLALERAGAQIVSIDSLRDQRLPALDGLFIGGGFPETQLDALTANVTLRNELAARIGAGLPTYAECGGLMYLARNIHWRDRRRPMVGIIPGEVHMHDRPQGRGYVRLLEGIAQPWPTLPGKPRGEIRAHEFHYSSLELDADASPTFAYEVQRGTGIDGHHDGLVLGNLLASYTHQRHTRDNPWADRFVAFIRQHANSGAAKLSP